MFPFGGTSDTKKKGKQATKGEAQVYKDNLVTVQFYKTILTVVNAAFLGVHIIFYFITGFATFSYILFAITSALAWFVWSYMRQVGTVKSGGVLTDLNLEGSISEYAKDIIIAIAAAQAGSLIHRYVWLLLLAIPLYAIYKGIMLFFFSPYAQLRGGNQGQDDQEDDKKGGKRKVVRVARH